MKATVGEGEVVRVEKRVIRVSISGRLDDVMDCGVRMRKRWWLCGFWVKVDEDSSARSCVWRSVSALHLEPQQNLYERKSDD